MRFSIARSRFVRLAFAGLLAAPLPALAATPTAEKPYLGVRVEARANADSEHSGVTLGAVDPAGPAGEGGMKKGDHILSVGDTAVKTFDDLKNAIAQHKPGETLSFKVVRDGKEQTVAVKLGTMPAESEKAAPTPSKARAELGVFTQPLTPELKEHLGLKADNGVLVAQVLPNSPAAQAGLEEDDVITHVGDTAVATPEELRDAIQKAGAGKEVILKVVREQKEMELKAHLHEAAARAEAPDWLRDLPEGFGSFSGKLHPFFQDAEKVPALEKRIQELENRIHELEQKLAK